jgi:hypothetical protein
MAKALDAAECPFERQKPHLARWVGWYRGRGCWRKVAGAQTERECMNLLMAYRDPHRTECERCVLRAGVPPPPIRSREWRSE